MDFLIIFFDIFINVLSILIFIRVILSWVSISRDNIAVRFVMEVTEPIIAPFRAILPKGGFLDLSPLIAFFALQVLQELIHYLLKIR